MSKKDKAGPQHIWQAIILFFIKKYPSQQGKANEFCKVLHKNKFYTNQFFSDLETGNLKLDKHCILKDANCEKKFKKVIAQFLQALDTGNLDTEFVPDSTEAPSVAPSAEPKA